MSMICLSHLINNELSRYNNQKNISVENYKNNEKKISMPLHSGTHVDFPLHVLKNAKSLSDYDINDFIFKKPHIVKIRSDKNYIETKNLKDISNDVDLIIFKIENSPKRNQDSYALNNTGINYDTAKQIRLLFPRLKAVGINSMSINAYQNKDEGKRAHLEFLGKKPEILIIEDMKLDELKNYKLKKVIAAPLLIEGADGVPVTVLGEIEE